jgi:hypothetical protein
MQVESPDRWQWRPDQGTGYSVCDAYQILTSHEPITLEATEDLLWHKQVPLKVSILAWHLLRDWLPTKTNLVARVILSLNLDQCVTCCGGAESAQHLFLSCGTFGSLWPLVRAWIGFLTADAHNISVILRSFCSVHLFSRRPQGPTVLFATCVACLCLGCVDREKPSRFHPFRNLCVSAIWQSQDVCIPVVEGD